MSFQENLQKKMILDRMARRLQLALPAVRKEYESIDKAEVRRFMEQTGYKPEKIRGLELYRHGGDGLPDEVLVLDNELPLYRNVSPEEVAMRRNPEVREIFSVANVKKIMNDHDILVAKGRAAIAHVHDRAVSELDLRFTADDIKSIVSEGGRALAARRAADLAGQIDMLFDLLGYQEMEKIDIQCLYGRPEPEGYRDIVMLREAEQPGLRLAKGSYAPEDDASMEALSEMAAGLRPPDAEGGEVLSFLGREALRLKAA
ncbi:MAG: hypothetical protein V2A77_09850 [Pseudomonadota bacterium]